MAILKLAVGLPLTMKVASAESVKGNFRQEIKFTSPNGDTVFIGEEVALRQLGRFALAPRDVPGKTLKFEKVEKAGGTKFINIDVVAAVEGNGTGGVRDRTVADAPTTGNSSVPKSAASAQHASASVTSPSAPAPSGHELYAKITAWVLKEIVPQYKAVGITPTQEGTAAICATLFIAKNGRH